MAATFSASAIFKAVDQITGPIKRMSSGVQSFSNSITRDMARAQGSLMRFKTTIGNIGSYVSIAGVAAFSNQAIKFWGESQAAIANVEAGIMSTNNALGITSQQFQKMAGDWQRITIFEDDAILQNVTAQLQTFTRIGESNFDRIQKAALDVTSKIKGVNATGEDLRSTSIQLGKAMNDPIKGMTALRRIGISFTDQTINKVKALASQGRYGAAQAVMLNEIEKQYGGAAEAIGKTAKGMELIKKNAMSDQMEKLGQSLEPIKSALLNIASIGLKIVNFLLDNPIGNVILGAVVAWKAYAGAMMIVAGVQAYYNTIQMSGISSMRLIVLAIGAIIGIVVYLIRNWDSFSDSTKRIIKIIGLAVGTIGLIVTIIKTATAIQRLWNAALIANPIGLIITGISLLVAGIILLIKHWDKVKKKMDEWSNSAVFQIISLFIPIVKIIELIGFLQDRWNGIKKAFETGGFLQGILAIGKAILSFILNPIEVILRTIGKLTGLKWAIKGAESIGNIRGGLDKGIVNQPENIKPINPAKDQAVLLQRKILETNSMQKLQINIDDSTGRARIGGDIQAIPVTVRNTKGFGFERI